MKQKSSHVLVMNGDIINVKFVFVISTTVKWHTNVQKSSRCSSHRIGAAVIKKSLRLIESVARCQVVHFPNLSLPCAVFCALTFNNNKNKLMSSEMIFYIAESSQSQIDVG